MAASTILFLLTPLVAYNTLRLILQRLVRLQPARKLAYEELVQPWPYNPIKISSNGNIPTTPSKFDARFLPPSLSLIRTRTTVEATSWSFTVTTAAFNDVAEAVLYRLGAVGWGRLRIGTARVVRILGKVYDAGAALALLAMPLVLLTVTWATLGMTLRAIGSFGSAGAKQSSSRLVGMTAEGGGSEAAAVFERDLRQAAGQVGGTSSGIFTSSAGWLQPLVPGISIPFSHLPHLCLALLLAQLFHELGHALAAACESTPLHSTGLRFFFLPVPLPSLFVSLPLPDPRSSPLDPDEKDTPLPASTYSDPNLSPFPSPSATPSSSLDPTPLSKSTLIRISSAGVVHSLLLGLFLLPLSSGLFTGAREIGFRTNLWTLSGLWLDRSEDGVVVMQVEQGSALKDLLKPGSLVAWVNDVKIGSDLLNGEAGYGRKTQIDMWSAYLTGALEKEGKEEGSWQELGWCVDEAVWERAGHDCCLLISDPLSNSPLLRRDPYNSHSPIHLQDSPPDARKRSKRAIIPLPPPALPVTLATALAHVLPPIPPPMDDDVLAVLGDPESLVRPAAPEIGSEGLFEGVGGSRSANNAFPFELDVHPHAASPLASNRMTGSMTGASSESGLSICFRPTATLTHARSAKCLDPVGLFTASGSSMERGGRRDGAERCVETCGTVGKLCVRPREEGKGDGLVRVAVEGKRSWRGWWAHRKEKLRRSRESGTRGTEEDLILFQGTKEDIWRAVRVGTLQPRFDWVPVRLPEHVELFFRYLLSLTFALALFNLLPLPGVDGSSVLYTVAHPGHVIGALSTSPTFASASDPETGLVVGLGAGLGYADVGLTGRLIFVIEGLKRTRAPVRYWMATAERTVTVTMAIVGLMLIIACAGHL